MAKRLANYPPVPCFLHFVASGGTLAGRADKMQSSKKHLYRGTPNENR
jgi:hypothetical protein